MGDTVLGMSLTEMPEDPRLFPLAALVVVKGVDEDGITDHAVLTTPGLDIVDAVGMSHFAVLHSEAEVMKVINAVHEEE